MEKRLQKKSQPARAGKSPVEKRETANASEGASGKPRSANGGGQERSKRSANEKAGRRPAHKPQPAPAQPAPGKDYAAMLSAGLKFCPHARECGACQTVNEPYEESLLAKDEVVYGLYHALAASDAIEPIIGMDDPFYYRNKVISPFAAGKRKKAPAPARGGKDGRGVKKPQKAEPREILCGMYAQGSHRIVDTRHCLVENEQAKAVVYAVRDLMRRWSIAPYDEDAGTGFLRHAVVRVGHKSGEVLVTLVTNDEAFPSSRSFCRELVRLCPYVTTVVQNVNTRQTNVVLGQAERVLYGPGFILDELCGLSFRVSSRSFYQVNARQTEVLYDTAISLAGLDGTQTVIDAYCGTGTIGLVAAKRGAARVIGVDNVESSIRDARENARHNGAENVRFEVADADEFMVAMAKSGETADVLLMDPPRAGASEAFLRAAALLRPSRVVYISCNPKTQVRDVKYLVEHGYDLKKVQPVDMFPHTGHIESIALLQRVSEKAE